MLPASAERYVSLTPGLWLQSQTSSVDYSLRPVSVDYSPGWSLGAAVGGAYENGCRLETELIYRQALPKQGNDNTWIAGMLMNLWWEARSESGITPYFGGGFGGARAHVSSPGLVDNSGGGVSYQVGGGIGIRIDPRLVLDIGYRYFGVWDVNNSGNIGNVNLSVSSITTGLRVGF